MHQFLAHIVVGDVGEAEVELAAATSIAAELRQPAQLWQIRGAQVMVALGVGRLVEAEALILQALALGERAQPDAAIPHYWVQRYTLCDFRGGLEEVEPAIRDLVAEYPARPVFRCVLAHLHALLGRLPEAKRALDDLAAQDFSALPFDQEWLYGMSLLAETSALVSDTDSAPVLYGLHVPWAAFNAVDVAEGFKGSVSRYLALLAATLERRDDATRHFEDALTMNERMGARPWLAHTQSDYARMLLARGGPGDRERAEQLFDLALATYRELGMETYAARFSAATPTR